MIRYKGLKAFTRRTLLGEPFTVYREEPLVPRIDNRFLDCSVYLYPTLDDANQGKKAGGSGFLVAVPGYGDGWMLEGRCPRSDIHHLYVVSNRHLIKRPEERFTPSPVVRLNTHAGQIDVIDVEIGDWVCSEEHDLAVLPIPYRKYHKYLSVSVDDFLTKPIASERDVGIGDEVFMVGRFVRHDGVQRNMPSARFGHISMLADANEPCHHPSNKSEKQESFLIEIHSMPGYSGSPVFVRPFSAPKLLARYGGNTVVSGFTFGGGPHEPSEVSGGPWLLGVEWGYIRNHDQSLNNTGMSCVVPAWLLRDLLDAETLKDQRRMEQEEEKSLAEQGGTVETGGRSRLPPRSQDT